MLFTQNIDCLERAAGVPAEKIVEAHGSFQIQHCIECKSEFPDDLMRKAVQNGEVPHCLVPQCNGLVKPDIVFFGEALPEIFRQSAPMVSEANLVIIMGTSLSVHPFASLPDFVSEGVPRVLINLERVGGLGSRADDVCILSDCDDGVKRLAEALDWREEAEALWKEVSGKETAGKNLEAQKDIKTKDQVLEEEIESLTREVDHTLKISTGHRQFLEDHLGKKLTSQPSSDTPKSAQRVTDNQSDRDELHGLGHSVGVSNRVSDHQITISADEKHQAEDHARLPSNILFGHTDRGNAQTEDSSGGNSKPSAQIQSGLPSKGDLDNKHDEYSKSHI